MAWRASGPDHHWLFRESHNRRLGELLGTGVETEKALTRLGITLPEGAQNAPIVLRALGAGTPFPSPN